ncbi:metal ABC transporter permease [Lysinibacillus sp. FSL M8-0216]|uniref:Manganese/zinc/iron transport system permease protein n=1 Tax=Lysinibacillus fusiformis TaxID=28031 RepID=A0A1H9K6P0_9BACI|nr:metal ABC transporter permease [Lysinibacillus fusiformis]SCX58820.1 manganese/zinc/iron transport system permease protein [Lysinibacillus fusiformis]SCY47774.1 manganese/zinc/iron transport system permease protein [Lysinibacillus fusiformis]SDB36818.1 manganese/zinc/iron transport system permease protein [Lysinibacillus fusiformis]SEN85015.1 manganese/zinc/iron transport system permease protein [Lysinibacillus fusiformis]SEQ94794.1 manganese/zinc/iron transport system permease protein [Lys
MIEFWVVLTGLLVGVTCGIAGVFLILRKMSMIADAISHTVLFGIVMAYIITQSLNGLWMLIGAAVAGILTAYLVQLLHSSGIQEDAAIGVVFTSLFAAGVLLITLFASNVHLDVEHVLMGEIAFVPWDRWTVLGLAMPKAVWMLLLVLVINIVFLLLFFKEMKLATFDPVYAATIGIPVVFLHYGFMTSISFTTVAAFDSVGAILVVAMLIGPAATSYLISKTIKQMFIYSMLFGAGASVIGYYLAKLWDTSIAGMMATTVGLLFIITLISQKIIERRRKALVHKLELS